MLNPLGLICRDVCARRAYHTGSHGFNALEGLAVCFGVGDSWLWACTWGRARKADKLIYNKMIQIYYIKENKPTIKQTGSFSSQILQFLLDFPTNVRRAAYSIIETTWNRPRYVCRVSPLWVTHVSPLQYDVDIGVVWL